MRRRLFFAAVAAWLLPPVRVAAIDTTAAGYGYAEYLLPMLSDVMATGHEVVGSTRLRVMSVAEARADEIEFSRGAAR